MVEPSMPIRTSLETLDLTWNLSAVCIDGNNTNKQKTKDIEAGEFTLFNISWHFCSEKISVEEMAPS